MTIEPVPLADLHAQYLSLKGEIDAAIADVIAASAFIRGPFVERFEAEFALAAQAAHCVSCANGTDALYIAFTALGLRPGDEVITTAHSWISTSEAITQAGGSVVFCDTGRDDFTLDPADLAAKIGPRTVGIVPVHLYGRPADMGPILALAERHGLWVVEDCAQAHLATYAGAPIGGFGQAATWSFYPGKNLGAMGDAGAITTRDADLARRMARFARHGGLAKGRHEIEGINSRLDGLQAAVLSAKLPHLPRWTEARRARARAYAAALAEVEGLTLPIDTPDRPSVWHLYVVRHDRRDALAGHLAADGVHTGINYPTALPFLPAYDRLGHRPEDFPNAYHNQSRILSLPLFAEMTDSQQGRVIEALLRFGDA